MTESPTTTTSTASSVDRPRIVCVSNRLPVTAIDEGDSISFQPSSGGLVTAMGPILRKSRGAWIGWPGSSTRVETEVRRALAEFSDQSDFDLYSVPLGAEAVAGFYQGFSNQIIWPLFHDLQSRCNFEPAFWSVYLAVQELYCKETLERTKPSDLVWVHDYHLMGLGRSLRDAGLRNKLCFFFHTPFPAPDIFLKLPWRLDVIESMLSYDLIGFQTTRDQKNFIDCVERLTDLRGIPRGVLASLKTQSRETFLGSFPISIDFSEFDEAARSPEVERGALQLRADMNAEYLVLSVDRLDYTKGIPHRIRAFRRLLEIEPSLKRRIALLQVVVPSRVEVTEYQLLRSEIEQLVTQLNGELGEPGWVPVHHLFRSFTREDLIAMYRAADVALVTPLKDGMNLVAKEYCASSIDEQGALVLSEFAGSADEFADLAFLVNPYDFDGVAYALSQALLVAQTNSTDRMVAMRALLRKADVFSWASAFLDAANWKWPSLEETPRPKTVWEKLKGISKVFDM